MKGHFPSPFTIFPSQLIDSLGKEFWNYNSSGFCFTEVSHRSKNYASINQSSQQLIRQYFKVPQNYKILYLQGYCGLASVPFNLCKTTGNRAIYVVTDGESEHAYQQAIKINPTTVRVDSLEQRKGIFEKAGEEGNCFYTFYSKVSFQDGAVNPQPEILQGEILVCSLNRCSHYEGIDASKHGLILLQTGYGIGLSGMSIVIVRQDLVEAHLSTCPDLMEYKMISAINSIVNTPYTLVPLLIHRQLQLLLASGFTLEKVKEELGLIREEYLKPLQKLTTVKAGCGVGQLKFKISEQMSRQTLQEYGVVQGDWVLLLLQLENKGKGQLFAQKLLE